MDTQQTLSGDVERYVGALLRAPLRLHPWREAHELPPYLRAAYTFQESELRDEHALWMLAGAPVTPVVLEKHVAAVRRWWAGLIIPVFAELPAITRHRLVERGVAFVVPGVQTFLPDLHFEHRERARRLPESRDTLRPSAQALLLYLLRQPEGTAFTPTDLVPTLGYSLMTLTRALEELRAAELVVLERRGRPSIYRLAAGQRDVWNLAQQLLRNPVMRREIASSAVGEEPLAGLSALATMTMLAAPPIEVYAVTTARARELRAQVEIDPGQVLQEHEQQLEIWSYDPRVLSDGPTVDPLSLYLSLRDDPDERVQAALAEMLESLAW